MDTILKRNCPKCGKEVIYKNKISYKRALKDNPLCRKCVYHSKGGLGTYDFTGTNNPFYGKKHSKATINKLKKDDKSYTQTKDFKDKQSASHIGAKNSMYGKNVYNIWVKKYGEREAKRREAKRRKKISKWNNDTGTICLCR